MDPNEVFGWLHDQGWNVERAFHPSGGLHFLVQAGSRFEIYEPKDKSLVFLTDYRLSERQVLRLVQLDQSQYLGLIWDLRSTLLTSGFTHTLYPVGCELTELRAGFQLWEPALTKNAVLRECVRVSDLPQLLHALLEKHLSVAGRWELESERALPPIPGDRPIVRLV